MATTYHDNGKIAYSSSGTFYNVNGKIVKKLNFSIGLRYYPRDNTYIKNAVYGIKTN